MYSIFNSFSELVNILTLKSAPLRILFCSKYSAELAEVCLEPFQKLLRILS